VVIGGGIAGCSLAFHLAELGWREIVLVERNMLSSGTTWHAAGDLLPMQSTLEGVQFVRDSIELYTKLSGETGQDIGRKRCGTLLVFESEDRMKQQQRSVALWRSVGGVAEIVTSKEIARLNPFIRTDDLVGGLYSPDAYRVNPADVTQAIAKAARKRGVRILENTRVINLELSNYAKLPCASAVVTDKGRIDCETFVIACGAWSRDVGKLARVNVPLHAVEHSYLISERVEGVDDKLPITRNPDSWFYSREEMGGFLIGFFEPGAKPLCVTRLPHDLSFANLPEDWDHFAPYIERALHRYPSLETVGVKMLFTGPESFTPDISLIMGEAPGLRNVFVLAGFNSSGIMLGGGAAKVLAEWIVGGEPNIDTSHIDIRRFSRAFDNTQWLAERVKEVPSRVLKVQFPDDEFETGRDLNCTAFHERLSKRGARFGQVAGWEQAKWFAIGDRRIDETLTFGRPGWLEIVSEEHRAARQCVALNASTLMGVLQVAGPDAKSLLQLVCANNIAVEQGRIVYTPMLNSRGGIESDFTVTRVGEEVFLVVSGISHVDRDRDRLLRFAAGFENVSVTDVTSNYATLAINGPKSRELLEGLTDRSLSNSDFPYLSARDIQIRGIQVMAYRISYAGELGWELYIPASDALSVYDALWEAGADLGLRHMGSHASNSLRLEKAYRAWGRDISPADTPLEAGLDYTVRFNKEAPFIGRDALLRQLQEGVRRRLVLFTLDDLDTFPYAREPIWRNGRTIGHVTSAGFGHWIGRMIAMGYVHNGRGFVDDDYILSGTYEIEIADRKVPAIPQLMPPYDPKGDRVRG
jgi:4-methylaminobutanoate oxidase (formaldehyde-forming)